MLLDHQRRFCTRYDSYFSSSNVKMYQHHKLSFWYLKCSNITNTIPGFLEDIKSTSRIVYQYMVCRTHYKINLLYTTSKSSHLVYVYLCVYSGDHGMYITCTSHYEIELRIELSKSFYVDFRAFSKHLQTSA